MKRFLAAIFAIWASLTAGALAQGPNDLNSGSQLICSGTTGACTFSWWGTAGNTYLIETSDDLINWSYLPIVETGSDAAIQWGFSSNSGSLFMKLEYITVPASEISGNVFTGPTDPVSGLPGDWELFYYGYLGVDPNADPNGEGFTNLQDYENGNNPIINQTVSVGPCVGEYLFHEMTGTIAHDISSLHNNGLLSGGASWATGGYDGEGAIAFDGTSGEVLISNTGNQVFSAAGAPFSFAFWFDPASLTGTTTLITDEISGTSGFEFGIDSTTSPPSLLFSTAGSGGIQMETPFQPGAWTQAAVTYDGTTATIYINGSEAASGTGAFVSNTNTITLANGLSGTQPFVGAMEDLTLYQAVLRPWDVDSLYNLSTTPTGSDPSGIPNWWKYRYFGTLSVNPVAFVTWSGSQTTILQAYENGLNPNDFYNGLQPVLSIVSGTYQTGPQGAFVSAPLVVSVSDTNGNPLSNAPVTFTVASGGGSLQGPNVTGSGSTVTVMADASGQAEAFFSLPAVDDNVSDVSVTAGPPGLLAQVDFQEASVSGAVSGPAPQAPSNVIGYLNSDGSETLVWKNNDTKDAIYIYLQSGGTWSVAATLNAGTTTYLASAAMAGLVEVGNPYTPGGSTGAVSGGGDPGIKPVVPIPTQNYVVIDLSGTLTTNASMIALDDTNNAMFAYSSTNSVIVKSWVDGVVQTVQTVAPISSGSDYDTGEGEVHRTINLYPTSLTPGGKVYGNAIMGYNYSDAGSYPSFILGFSSVSGAFSLIGANDDIIEDPLGTDWTAFKSSFGVGAATDNAYAGTGNCAPSYTSSPDYPYGYLFSGGSYTYFTDPTLTDSLPWWVPDGGSVNGGSEFYLVGMNDNGSMLFENYTSSYNVETNGAVWSGGVITTLNFQPADINNQGEVVGNALDPSGSYISGTGVLWEPGTSGTGTTLANIPSSPIVKQWLMQIGDVYPTMISNANPVDGSRQIVFFPDDENSPGYILTINASGTATQLSTIQWPTGVTIPNSTYNSINAAGIISALGQPNVSTSGNHALLLVPVQFTITRPNAPNANAQTAPTNTVPRDEIVDVKLGIPQMSSQDLTVGLDLGPSNMKTQALGARGNVQMYDFGQQQTDGSTETDLTQITLKASDAWQEHFKAVFNKEGTVDVKATFALASSGTTTVQSQDIVVQKQVRKYGYDDSGYNFNQYDQAFQTASDYWGGFYFYPLDDVDRLKAMGMDESSLGQVAAYPGGADDIMSYGWTLDPDIHVLHNDPTYVDENGTTQRVPPEMEYVPATGMSRIISYPAAATTPPATAIYWATCELYHKAQVFDNDGDFVFWRTWDGATKKYNGGGVSDYLMRVDRAFLEGKSPDGTTYLWPIQTDFFPRTP